jgi:hypothetical protein
MHRFHRRTAPKVREGVVQRQNRWEPSPSYWNTPPGEPVIDRQPPGPGHRHLLSRADVRKFLSLLPHWDEVSRGLRAIVLATAEPNCDGWYNFRGVIALCAWERQLYRTINASFHAEHADIFDRLGVEREPTPDGRVECRYTPAAVRRYQLLHVLLHELGHHHDRQTTRSRRRPARGEPYANAYAREFEKLIFERYLAAFGLDP